MKKFIAILTAALMLAAAVPAFAFTGFDEEPEMPVVSSASEEFFPVTVTRMENEPVVIEPEHPWEEPVNEWVPMEEETPFAAGDTVTFACEIAVPETIEGFDEEALSSIEAKFDFSGVDEMEIVDAINAERNVVCDFEIGICYPMPGYGNVSIEEGCVVIDALLNKTVTVIVQGTASSESVSCGSTVTIGQYELPAHFSVGKLAYEEDCYFIYYKDTVNVQMRGMKFFAEDGVFDHYLVYFNNHDYVREEDDGTVVYFEEGHEDDFIFEGEVFDALELAYDTYMGFFGFTDDDIGDVMTDSVFLYGCEPVRFETEFTFGAGEEEPLPGDADGNGYIDTTDALYVLRAALGITDNAAELIGCCDMDNNGVLDTTDALLVLRRALNIG